MAEQIEEQLKEFDKETVISRMLSILRKAYPDGIKMTVDINTFKYPLFKDETADVLCLIVDDKIIKLPIIKYHLPNIDKHHNGYLDAIKYDIIFEISEMTLLLIARDINAFKTIKIDKNIVEDFVHLFSLEIIKHFVCYEKIYGTLNDLIELTKINIIKDNHLQINTENNRITNISMKRTKIDISNIKLYYDICSDSNSYKFNWFIENIIINDYKELIKIFKK